MIEFILYLLCIASLDGSCADLDHYMRPAFEDLPAVATWYDPSLGGINCDDDCTRTADGSMVSEELYGVAAACDRSLLGSIVAIDGLGTFECRDTGSAIRPTWSPHHDRWVLYFDVMLHDDPSWNYWIFEHWSIVGNVIE